MEEDKNFEQIAIIPITIGELTAPIQASIEESKLTDAVKRIIMELMSDIRRLDNGDFYIPPELLAWIREYRALLKDIYGFTEGVRKEVGFKKVDIIKEFILKGKLDMNEDTKLSLIRSLSKDLDKEEEEE